MQKIKNKIKYNGGAAMMILVSFFVFISLTIIIGIVNPTVREFKIASDSFKSKQAYFLAESGIEDVVYRLKNSKQTSASETIVLGDSTAVTTIINLSGNQKQIFSLGDTDSLQRKLDITLSTGIGVSFSYGVQTGKGGLSMSNNSSVIGSVYSNGPITGSGAITGSATSANSSALASDQSNGLGTPTYDVSFGNASSTQDFAQSFQVSTTEVVSKVRLYLKKVGKPSNITVRIVNDASGVPSTITKTSGTLLATLVSTSYGWVDVLFSTNPQLDQGTTYWIVVDADTSSSNYYKTGANNDGYANGASKIGKYGGTWNNNNPSTIDGFFNLFLGGITGLIDGITIGTDSTGNAYSRTVNNSTVRGTNYCQSGSGNNKSCNTSLADPVELPMPISDQNIQDWKTDATTGGTFSGDYNLTTNVSLGPKRITGNLNMTSSNKILTVTGVIYVEGNINIDNGSTIKCSSSFGANSCLILADGWIHVANNALFKGSGTSGSYIMLLTTLSGCNGGNQQSHCTHHNGGIDLHNNASGAIFYAPNSLAHLHNGVNVSEIIAYKLELENNAVVTYEQGLINANFSSGPSGGWNINSWKEVE